ncbi:hypothetical protein FHW12_003128 [Dokdonella fugitiva]|uniref:Uncharacterized protein n=1 Tax=Dokdonella fugitiva TaxID=328517 RepID=A0A839F4C5_9GAMM|nr:hypothetical protein [Dokdonella fugitiva]MBA8888892.1 hypothetical protein [Dokdonella fugitiva]
MTTQKRKPGRPRKTPPGQSLEQFSIRLSTKLKLALDLLAHHRGVSLSDAIAMLVTQAARSTEARPGTTLDELAEMVVDLEGPARDAYISQTFPQLATPKQRFYNLALHELYARGCPAQPKSEIDLYDAAMDAFKAGESPTQFADRWEGPLGIRPWHTISDAELNQLTESTTREFGLTLFDGMQVFAEVERRKAESKQRTRSKMRRVK